MMTHNNNDVIAQAAMPAVTFPSLREAALLSLLSSFPFPCCIV